MTQKNEHTYKALDIDRYHSGEMTAAERHALEKAALEDPFLSDALEGYAVAQNPVADREALHIRLLNRLSRKKSHQTQIIPLFNKPFLKVAALLLIMASLGLIIYQVSGVKTNELATNKEVKTVDQRGKDSAGTKESGEKKDGSSSEPQVTNKNEVAFNSPKKTKEIKTATNKKDVGFKKEAPVTDISAMTAMVADTSQNLNATTAKKEEPMMTRRMAKADVSASYMMHGKIVDEENMGLSNTTITSKKTKQKWVTDADGNFSFLSLDSSIDIILNRPGFPATEAKISYSKNNLITIKTTGDILKEEGLPSKKDSSSFLKTRIKVEGTEPNDGWSLLEKRIVQNLKTAKELNIKGEPGDVHLSFVVDANGSAKEIKVEKSMCDECAAEAVRFLLDGPKWKSTEMGKRAKAIFLF